MNKKTLFLLLFSLCLIILETMAYKSGESFSIIASRIWVIMGIFYFSSCQYYIFNIILEDLKNKYFLGLLSIISVIIITLWGINSFTLLSVNHESTQQVAQALNNIKEPDFHYTKYSFLGYPSRQYIITALPSIIFGRNPITLRTGYAIPFLIGICLFYVGLRTTLKNNSYGHFFSAILIISITSFSYVVEFLKNYEQSILPISFTMQALGWFLISFNKQTVIKIINLIWIGSMLATSYTPGLGSWILLLIFILIITLQNFTKKELNKALIWSFCFITIFTFGINSFAGREDLFKKTVTSEANIEHIINNVFQGYSIFFFSDKKMFLNPLITLPVFIYMAHSLFMFKSIHTLITIWTLIIIAISVALKGYANPPPLLSIHRAMIIIPIIITGFVFFILSIIEKKDIFISKKMFYLLFLMFFSLSFWNLYKVIKDKPLGYPTKVIKNLISQTKILGVKDEKPINIAIFSDNIELISIEDYLGYFFPTHNLLMNNKTCLDNFNYLFDGIIYLDNSSCLNEIIKRKNLFNLNFSITTYNQNQYKTVNAVYKVKDNNF